MKQSINISLLITLFFIYEVGFAQKTKTINIYQKRMDSIQDIKAQNWKYLSIEEKVYDYYNLCNSYKNDSLNIDSLKTIAFKAEFQDVADTLSAWLHDSDKKLELIVKKLSEINSLGSFFCGNITIEKFRREFYQKAWLEYANSYKKYAKENPTRYIALLLLSRQNNEAIDEMIKHSMEPFSFCGFYLLLITGSQRSEESLSYMEKYLAIAEEEDKIPAIYRIFGYISCELQSYTKSIEYLEKIPKQEYLSKDYAYLGEAYLNKGGSSADTTKAVSLLFEAIKKGQLEAKKK